MLHVYTQEEFDAIERDDFGYKVCPTGDYTAIKDFGNRCWLGNCCILGDWCWLGNGCILGDWCILGDYCKLGSWCILGDQCKLGDGCILGNRCTLGNGCILGDGCSLGNRCILGDLCKLGNKCKLGEECKLGSWCILGDQCKLGDGCKLESGRVENAAFIKCSNIGSRNDTAYGYCNTETGDIFVRAGCWFSDIDAFVERVHEVHAGTHHESDYMAFIEYIRARFARYKKHD